MASLINSTRHLKRININPQTLLKQLLFLKKERTLPNSFYAANITLIAKPDKDVTRKQNYRTLSLINIHAKILNKILSSQTQQQLKGSYIMVKWDLLKRCKDGFKPINQCLILY